MLEIIRSMKELDIGQLMSVYTESNSAGGDILRGERNFYEYLLDYFAQQGAFYTIWQADGKYMSALRVEIYRDGYIIAGLETKPEARGRGYAKMLLSAVLDCFPEGSKIYSHVDKKNAPSISVHTACGFSRILEHAVYLDGSVLTSSCTFLKIIPAP